MKPFLYCLLPLLLSAQEPLRINCGGGPVIEGTNLWRGDVYYQLGSPWSVPTALDGILPVYSTMRYGNFSYQLPVPDGDYTVRLLFAETSTAITGPGQRKFTVNLNGSEVLTAYDIAADVGLRAPVDKTFDAAAANSSGIRLQFTTVLRNAIVSAIEILPKPRPPTSPSGWCPGPILSLVGDKTLVVGSAWTSANPCYIHQAIAPLSTDPLYVATLTASTVIQLSPIFTGDDDVFIWFTSPRTSTAATLTLATTQSLGSYYGSVGAAGTYHTTPKTFAPACTPVGIAYVRAGKWLPMFHTLLGSNQVYLDGSVPMSVRYGDGGVTLVLNPVSAAAQLLEERRNALAHTAAQSLADYLSLPGSERLHNLESLYATWQSERRALRIELDQLRNRPALELSGGQ